MTVTLPDEAWNPDIGEWFPLETTTTEIEEEDEEED
jgi:hypothetical protein